MTALPAIVFFIYTLPHPWWDSLKCRMHLLHEAAVMASIKIHAYGHDLCEGDKVSTPPHESCKNPSHELVQRRRTFRSSRLSPWQSEGGLDPRGAGIDRAEGTRRLHLRGSCSLGRSKPGSALPAFPRPRRAVDRRCTARLRSIRSYAGKRLGRWPSGCLHSLRPCRQSLSSLRKERAGLLFGDVRGRHPARSKPRITGSGAACLYRVADRHRAARRHNAGAAASPGPDDDTAHLGAVAWHRVTVRAR